MYGRRRMNRILSQPHYQELRQIIKEGINPLIFWIGAGVSKSAGIKLWDELRSDLENALRNKIAIVDTEYAKQLERQLKNIISISDNWKAFERMKSRSALGKSEFESCVKQSLKEPDQVNIPKVLSYIWDLNPKGIITTNIDNIISKSYSGETRLDVFCSRDLNNRRGFLNKSSKFVLHLHGMYDYSDSWVFTKTDIVYLMKLNEYKETLKSIFSNFTVIFIGCDATDIGASGFLRNIQAEGYVAGEQFWITSRNDRQSIHYCSTCNIKPIIYDFSNDDHSTPLIGMFKDIKGFKSTDTDPYPVFPKPTPEKYEIEDPDVLAASSPETIRFALSNEAAKILNLNRDNSVDELELQRKYSEFCEKYDEAIDRSWYFNVKFDDKRTFFGKTIKGPLGSGIFSNVYEVVDENQNRYALKLMQRDIRHNQNMLYAFRRGVQSMKILGEDNIEGVARIIDAYEIPASIIMEFIDGVDMETALLRYNLDKWSFWLPCILKVINIVRSAHQPPRVVLHRDIRPHNIMLRHCDNNNFNSDDIVVLDFDLSWYYGSQDDLEFSKDLSSHLGYIAPELLNDDKRYSARHAKIDTYGISMTLFYIFSGSHPNPNQSGWINWEEEVKKCTSLVKNQSWMHANNRISRIIISGTKFSQNERDDVYILEKKIAKCVSSFSKNYDSNIYYDIDIIGEEIFCLGLSGRDYYWDDDDQYGRYTSHRGISIYFYVDERRKEFTVKAERSDQGDFHFRSVKKYWQKHQENIISGMEKHGWKVDGRSKGGSPGIRMAAKILLSDEEDFIVRSSKGIIAMMSEISFEE